MLWRPISAVIVVLAVLGVAELLWRKQAIHGENARKFIHILVGSFVAFLPFWVDYGWIVLFAIGAIVLSFLNHYHRFFKAGMSIKRRSYGDLFLAIAIFICAIAQPDPWIFMAAMLFVALADGLAALVGIELGKYHGHLYKVLRHEKSAIGTATFIVVSFIITAFTVYFSGLYRANSNAAFTLIFLPIAGALTENVGIFGLDNLLLPVLVLVSLTILSR